MAEKPEELLPQKGISTVGDGKEVRSPATIKFEEKAGGSQRRERK
jgi:hypothetical protein